jgi:hypothetical protein
MPNLSLVVTSTDRIYLADAIVVVYTVFFASPRQDARSPNDRYRILVVRRLDTFEYLLLVRQHKTCDANTDVMSVTFTAV